MFHFLSDYTFNNSHFIISADGNPDEFLDFITLINKQLESLFMEIRRGCAEDTGDVFFSLVCVWPVFLRAYTCQFCQLVLKNFNTNSKHWQKLATVQCGLFINNQVKSINCSQLFACWFIHKFWFIFYVWWLYGYM